MSLLNILLDITVSLFNLLSHQVERHFLQHIQTNCQSEESELTVYLGF